jgi:hypothetical protein
MADLGIYTKNADIQALAGVNAGTTAKATAATDVYVLNVEAAIDVATGYDWSSAWTAGGILDETLRNVLIQAGAAKCAMFVANADPSGYPAREFETLLDFLNEVYNTSIAIIKDKDGAAMMRGEA